MNEIWTSTEFVAAIVGAIVGGAIPIAAQNISERRSSLKRDYATAISLFLKLMDIYTTTAHVRAHLQEGFTLAQKEGLPRSATTLPLVNHPLPVQLTTDEKSLALMTSDNDFMNAVLNIDRTYNTSINMSPAYAKMRAEVASIVKGFPDAGGAVIVGLKLEQAQTLAVLRFQMDQLLAGWFNFMVRDEHDLRWMLDVLGVHIRRLYNPRFRIDEISIVRA